MPIIEGFTEQETPKRGAIEGFTPYNVPEDTGRAKPKSRSALEFANDTVVTGVNSVLGLGKAISDFVSVDNPVSRGLQYVIDEGEKTYSEPVRQGREALAQSMQGDTSEQLKGVARYVYDNPIQTAAQVLGNVGGVGALIKGGRGLAAAAKLGEKGKAAAGLGTGAVVGGAAGGGDAAGDAYEQVMRSPNVDPSMREQLARQAAREASVVPGLIGAGTGMLGLERLLARGAGAARVNPFTLGAKEFGQEAFEEGATKASANFAARQYDPSIDPWSGVAGSSALGGVMGAAAGTGVGFLNNRALEADLLRRDQRTAADARALQERLAPILGLIRDNPGVPMQDWVGQQAGVSNPLDAKARTSREADILAAFNAPSGVRVSGAEPPVAPGMTRLYHGSAAPGRVDGSAWFSTDREYARNYRPGAQLQYVDYPTDKVNAQLDPDGYGQTVEKGFTWNGELDTTETGPRNIVPDGQERELTAIEALLMQQGLPTTEAPAAAAPTTAAPTTTAPTTTAPAAEAPTATAPPASKVFSAEEQELLDLGVVPNKRSLELLGEIKASGLPLDSLTPVITAMSQTKNGQAKKLLAAAIIESKKAASNGVPSAPAGEPGVGGAATSTDPVGGVGVAGRPADVSTDRGGSAPVAGTASGQADVLPGAADQSTAAVTPTEPSAGPVEPSVATTTPEPPTNVTQASQALQGPQEGQAPADAGTAVGADGVQAAPAESTAPVISRKRKRVVTPVGPANAFVAPEVEGTATAETEPGAAADTTDDAAELERLQEIARLTGRDIDPSVAETPSDPEPELDPVQALAQLFSLRFVNSKNPSRDTDIARAYQAAMRAAPQGSGDAVKESIAKQFNLSTSTVEKLGNVSKFLEAGSTLGFSSEQVLSWLGATDNSKAAPTQLSKLEAQMAELRKQPRSPEVVQQMSELNEQIVRATPDEQTDEADSEVLEDAGFDATSGMGGNDKSESWKQGGKGRGDTSNVTDETAANQLFSLSTRIQEATDALSEAALGNPSSIAALEQEIERLTKQYGEKQAALAQRLRAPGYFARKIAKADKAGKAQAAPDGDAVATESQSNTAQASAGAATTTKAKATTTLKATGKRAAKTPTATAPEAQSTVGLTRQEAAGQAWDRAAAQIPGAPQWWAVPDQIRNEFVGFGENNWTRQDVVALMQKPSTDALVPTDSETPSWRALRDKSHDKEQPGDVMLATNGKFVSLADALEAARSAVQAGTLRPDAPFQYNAVLDIAPRDWDRMVQAMTGSNPKFGKSKPQSKSKRYSAAELIDEIKQFIRADVLPSRKLVVVDTVGDLLLSRDPVRVRLGAEIALKDAYGVAADGTAYLIADRIQKGQGRAKFMHEVGAHLGLENLLPKATYDKLVAQLRQWATRDDGSQESVLANKALVRVEQANTPVEDQDAEFLAYFVEEAVQSGIDPTANVMRASEGLRSWFRTLWAAFKVAIRQLGMRPETLTAPDVVNLAFGAARLEITGTWHGTPNTFRAFSGKKVGRSVAGWGLYTAEDKAGTKDFMPSWGNLLRTDTAVSDSEMLDYNRKVREQPAPVKAALSKIFEQPGVEDFIQDAYGHGSDDLSGTDLMGRSNEYPGLLSRLLRDGFIDDLSLDSATIAAMEARDDRPPDYHKAASLYLDSLGVKGIRVLDRPSTAKAAKDRAAGRPTSQTLTRNLVIFNDRNIFRVGAQVGGDPQRMRFGGNKRPLGNESVSINSREIEADDDIALDDESRVGAIMLSNIDRVYNGQPGRASAALREMTAWADANGKKLVLMPSGNINGSKDALVAWYERNGFVREDDGAMTRPPKTGMRFGKNALPTELQGPVKTITTQLSDTGRVALNTVMFTKDVLARAVSLGMKSANTLRTVYQERAALSGKLEREVERVVSLYGRIPESERGTGDLSANKFLYDSNREGKWGFKPDWRKKTGAVEDPALRARFDALSPQSQAFIRAVFKHGDDMLAIKKKTVLDSTTSEYDGQIAAATQAGNTVALAKLQADKAADLKRFKSLFDIQEFRPYSPMKRFGDFVVIARSARFLAADEAGKRKLESDPEHYHVDFAENRIAARELQSQLTEQGAFAEVVLREKESVGSEMYGGMLSAFTKLRATADAQIGATTDPKEAAALRQARVVIGELYLSTLAESSARKAEMRRRGVAGELDMIRSFATQGRADAQFVASAKYAEPTSNAINAMRKEMKEGGDQLKKSEVFNELLKRHRSSLDYDPSPIADKLARLSSIWYLATSPAYYLQNLTQPLMLSLPVMAGRHNYFKALAAQLKAYTDLAPMFRNAKLGESFNYAAAPPDVRQAISTLVDRGLIDIGLDSELGTLRVEGESAAATQWNKFDRMLRNLSQKMEVINRVSTAMAAYRLEVAKTGNAANALEYADSILEQTHGDYSRMNAPRAFNTSAGKVALQFRKFQLIQLSLMAKLIKNSFTGTERAAARKSLTYVLSHTAVMAGAIGLPGFAALAWAIKGLGGLMGDDDDEPLEQKIREFAGDEWATLVARGVPAALGLDLSGKLGSGNMLSLLPFNDLDLASRSGLESAGFALMGGPAGGLTLRAADGIGLIRDGQYYRGLEQLVPTGVSNAMKSYRTANEGVTRRNGDVLIAPEELADMASVWQALGLQPTQISERQFRGDIKFDTEERFKSRADRIRGQFMRARKADDTDATSQARDDWRELQDARQEAGFKRDPLSSLIRAGVSQDKRERNTLEGIQFDKKSRRFVEELVGDDD